MYSEKDREDEASPAHHRNHFGEDNVTHSLVGGAHAFILRISSLFGLAPLRFESLGSGFSVQLSNGMCVYSYILVTILGMYNFAFTALSVRARFKAVNDVLTITAKQLMVPVERIESTPPMNVFAVRVSAENRTHNISLLVDSLTAPPEKGNVVIIKKGVNGVPKLVVAPCEAIRRLASLHGALCDVVNRIDSSYGLPLIIILISTLLHLIFLWIAIHVLRMFVVVEPCHYTITEVFGAVTTYLVILIQFQRYDS
ncbi:unnamed protein product [Leptidea sinapis]|uniref:Gustatory receptor n=1 Tax=Leptidea sinapis TaxID=189913 RepID=A0A5E4QDU3_9NEOP|nr:unnamed protein product [Leptidea sinapis]